MKHVAELEKEPIAPTTLIVHRVAVSKTSVEQIPASVPTQKDLFANPVISVL